MAEKEKKIPPKAEEKKGAKPVPPMAEKDKLPPCGRKQGHGACNNSLLLASLSDGFCCLFDGNGCLRRLQGMNALIHGHSAQAIRCPDEKGCNAVSRIRPDAKPQRTHFRNPA
ncbi:hypothetical protein GF369_00985 [Candidatus Peregrinibacteria bacterium]|nr:hypothetical protein [Candidatus Peregrinibacteria bacterium]